MAPAEPSNAARVQIMPKRSPQVQIWYSMKVLNVLYRTIYCQQLQRADIHTYEYTHMYICMCVYSGHASMRLNIQYSG